MTDAPGGNRPVASFDRQAARFDARAGLSRELARAVASKLVKLGDLTAEASVLEVGAGTGEIGHNLVRRVGRYVALDASRAMLDVFGHRLSEAGLGYVMARAGVGSSSHAGTSIAGASWTSHAGTSTAGAPSSVVLVHGDAEHVWPLDDASAGLIFMSRVVHRLEVSHVVAETVRLASNAGASLLLGRVERARDGIFARLRRRMRCELEREGFRGRDGRRAVQAVLQALAEHGAALVAPCTVGGVERARSPAAVLAEWQQKPDLAGIPVPAEARARVLGAVRGWAEREIGDLETPVAESESYVLEGARLGVRTALRQA